MSLWKKNYAYYTSKDIIVKLNVLSNFKNIFFVFCFLLIATRNEAQITAWTFDPFLPTTANPAPNVGVGIASIVNLGGGVITPGARTGMTGTGCGAQTTGNAWAYEPFDPGTINESNGAQFSGSTVGYQNIIFTWDQRWSNTAANTVRLQYTTDGVTWIPFTMTAGNTTFCNGSINVNGCFEANATGDDYRRTSVNFSAIPATNNNPNFGVRLLAAFYQSTGQFRQVSTPSIVANPGGTWRFDNVSINGTQFPPPTASNLTAVGPTSICSGANATLRVTITGGTGPFTVVYSNGASTFTVTNYISGTNIIVTPIPPIVQALTTFNYTLISVANANGLFGTGNTGSPNINVRANLATVTAVSLAGCPGSVALSGGLPVGGTYSIANPYSGPTTTFTYSFTDGSFCPKVSNVVNFTRNTAPVITSQPTPGGIQTVCEGVPFTALTAGASGGGTLTYSWRRNTIAANVGGTITTILLTNSPTYTPPSNVVGGPFWYFVRITNTCGGVNSAVAGPFTVLPAAVGGTAIGNQSVCSDAPSDLTVTGFTTSITKWQYASDAAFTIPIDIPFSASATLTSLQMGVLTATRYYRAVAINGTCEAYSNVITVTYNTTTWNGSAWSNGVPTSGSAVIFAGNYNSLGDLNACSVQINSGNVVFGNTTTYPNHTLIIQNGLTISGGSLTFENNASLVQVNNVANSGSITYNRNTTPIRKFDYTYWSSPVQNQILANLSPNTLSDKYFWFDTTFYNWTGVTAPALTPMDIGKGYIIRAPQTFDPVTAAIFPASFAGVPNNGDYTVNIVKTGLNDLNCIGNPYPSALNADDFILNNTSAFGALPGTTLYFWTHNTAIANNLYTFDDYAVYNFTGGTGTGTLAAGANNATPNGIIAAGQSFMIKGVINGTTTATFTNSMREVGNNSQFFRINSATNLERNRFWLELKNNQGVYKQILIGYVENATDGFDNGYDGEILEAGNSASFYSILDTRKLAVQGKGNNFAASDQVPIGFKTTAAGTFEISLSDFEGLFENQDVFVEDTMLNLVINLKQSSYSFTSEIGTFESRFLIRFTSSTLGNSESDFNSNSIVIYKNFDQKNIVNSGVKKMKSIQIFDILGRLLWSKENINLNEITLKDFTSNSVLLISIELTDGQIFSRKYTN